ncbi:hypothetical protein GQ42DRAFT_155996 [Ramicandelaber brevisporus]|nr:hypothetical protein GQ42DRAFT_155996 [Ramicandelaber brevisporus]
MAATLPNILLDIRFPNGIVAPTVSPGSLLSGSIAIKTSDSISFSRLILTITGHETVRLPPQAHPGVYMHNFDVTFPNVNFPASARVKSTEDDPHWDCEIVYEMYATIYDTNGQTRATNMYEIEFRPSLTDDLLYSPLPPCSEFEPAARNHHNHHNHQQQQPQQQQPSLRSSPSSIISSVSVSTDSSPYIHEPYSVRNDALFEDEKLFGHVDAEFNKQSYGPGDTLAVKLLLTPVSRKTIKKITFRLLEVAECKVADTFHLAAMASNPIKVRNMLKNLVRCNRDHCRPPPVTIDPKPSVVSRPSSTAVPILPRASASVAAAAKSAMISRESAFSPQFMSIYGNDTDVETIGSQAYDPNKQNRSSWFGMRVLANDELKFDECRTKPLASGPIGAAYPFTKSDLDGTTTPMTDWSAKSIGSDYSGNSTATTATTTSSSMTSAAGHLGSDKKSANLTSFASKITRSSSRLRHANLVIPLPKDFKVVRSHYMRHSITLQVCITTTSTYMGYGAETKTAIVDFNVPVTEPATPISPVVGEARKSHLFGVSQYSHLPLASPCISEVDSFDSNHLEGYEHMVPAIHRRTSFPPAMPFPLKIDYPRPLVKCRVYNNPKNHLDYVF